MTDVNRMSAETRLSFGSSSSQEDDEVLEDDDEGGAGEVEGKGKVLANLRENRRDGPDDRRDDPPEDVDMVYSCNVSRNR